MSGAESADYVDRDLWVWTQARTRKWGPPDRTSSFRKRSLRALSTFMPSVRAAVAEARKAGAPIGPMRVGLHERSLEDLGHIQPQDYPLNARLEFSKHVNMRLAEQLGTTDGPAMQRWELRLALEEPTDAEQLEGPSEAMRAGIEALQRFNELPPPEVKLRTVKLEAQQELLGEHLALCISGHRHVGAEHVEHFTEELEACAERVFDKYLHALLSERFAERWGAPSPLSSLAGPLIDFKTTRRRMEDLCNERVESERGLSLKEVGALPGPLPHRASFRRGMFAGDVYLVLARACHVIDELDQLTRSGA